MAQSTISSPQAVCLGPTGEVEWAKAADLVDFPIMSATKAITSYWVAQTQTLPATWSIFREGAVPGSGSTVGEGDIVTPTDLYHCALLPSDNHAAANLGYAAYNARHQSWVGTMTADMEAWYATEFGWSGHDFATLSGLGLCYASARQIADVGLGIAADEAWLLTVMGTPSYTTTVGGPNARTFTVEHNNLSMKAGVEATGATLLGAKGGSGTGTYANLVVWEDPDGGVHSIGIVGAPSVETRNADIAAIVGDVMAEIDPDPDPPDPGEPSGLFRTSGDPVTLALTNGAPVVLT